MPPTAEFTNGSGDQIKLGTTGKIGSLMSREFESIKHSPHSSTSFAAAASSSSQKKVQEPPISIHCSYSPKRTQLRRNPHDEKNTSREKLEKKKRHARVVEVVDIKCNNPMSTRIKKLGFSKLSESIV